MPFSRPSLAAIIERIAADIESRLPGADARLRRSNLAVLARAEAGVAHGLYGYLDFLARQIIIDTADTDYLERWAAVWGLSRLPAVAATGEIAATSVVELLIPISVGTIVQRSDGAQFITTQISQESGPNTVTAQVAALVAGNAGNTAAGSRVTFASPIPGVNAHAVVGASGLGGGADLESDDDLRARLLARIRKPPHGGNADDYVAWAKEVAGVTRVWVEPLFAGAGTVRVYFVRDGDGTGAAILPDSGEIAAVEDHINTVRPVTADVTVAAPTALNVAFTLQITPDTTAVREAITAELTDLFRRESEPAGTILLSHLREAVSAAAGETDHVMSVPTANVVAAAGEMPMLGTITWV